MSNLRINIKIELQEVNDKPDNAPTELSDGSFEMVISEKDSVNIDKTEKAFLETAYPTIRKTISDHFSNVSKKKPLKKQKEKN